LPYLRSKKTGCFDGLRRGRIVAPEVKSILVDLILEAQQNGARLKPACIVVGISFHTFLRLKAGFFMDRRNHAPKHIPRKLSEAETEAFYQVANTSEYRDLTPGQIVASLLDKGIYFGSESTLYRILRKKEALLNRTESRKSVKHTKPTELLATEPNQVWCWDITWLKSTIAGLYYYAYVVIDIYSRKIVGWSIQATESADHASGLFHRMILCGGTKPLWIHSDNGGPMKGLSLLALLYKLKVNMSFSRPRVSDDNPFIESFFKTLKYDVSYPKAFGSLEDSRIWFADFVHGYNNHHMHSSLGYVTPNQKHTGQDIAIFQHRQKVLDKAAETHPERFVKGAKTLTPDRRVILNKAS
jgi:putative transposase